MKARTKAFEEYKNMSLADGLEDHGNQVLKVSKAGLATTGGKKKMLRAKATRGPLSFSDHKSPTNTYAAEIATTHAIRADMLHN